MKKVIVILFLLSNFSFANNYEHFCPANSPSKTFSGNLASLSGFNLLSRNIAKNILQKEIKKETGSKFKIKINNFYGTNILNGEFKSLQASSKKYEYDGIYLTDINIKTMCSYNHISYKDKALYFAENMVLNFNAKLTEDDFKKTLNSGKLNKNLVSLIKKASKHSNFYHIINVFLPLELPINIDTNNKGKLKLVKIEQKDKIISFDSYIIINKTTD